MDFKKYMAHAKENGHKKYSNPHPSLISLTLTQYAEIILTTNVQSSTSEKIISNCKHYLNSLKRNVLQVFSHLLKRETWTVTLD